MLRMSERFADDDCDRRNIEDRRYQSTRNGFNDSLTCERRSSAARCRIRFRLFFTSGAPVTLLGITVLYAR